MENVHKNVKISKKHHNILKTYCDEKGLKIYRVIEKWIDINCKPKNRGLYDE